MNYQRFRDISNGSFARVNGVLSADTITILSSLIAATRSGDFYNEDGSPLTSEQSDELDAVISRAFYELRVGDEVLPETLYPGVNVSVNPTTTGTTGTVGVRVTFAYPGYISQIRWYKATNDNGGRNAYVFDVATETSLVTVAMDDGVGQVGWVAAEIDPPLLVEPGDYVIAVDQPGGAGYPVHYQIGYHNAPRSNSPSLTMRQDGSPPQSPYSTSGLGSYPNTSSGAGIAFFVDIVYIREVRT